MGQQLMAIAAEGQRRRIYLAPTNEHEVAAKVEPPGCSRWRTTEKSRDFKTPNYGMTTFASLFTARQLTALTTFSDLVGEARAQS